MYSKLSRMLITKSRFSLIHRMAISHVPLKVPSTPLTPKASTIFGVKRKGTRYPLKVKKASTSGICKIAPFSKIQSKSI